MAATSCHKSSCGRACGRALWQHTFSVSTVGNGLSGASTGLPRPPATVCSRAGGRFVPLPRPAQRDLLSHFWVRQAIKDAGGASGKPAGPVSSGPPCCRLPATQGSGACLCRTLCRAGLSGWPWWGPPQESRDCPWSCSLADRAWPNLSAHSSGRGRRRRRDQGVPADAALPAMPGLFVQWPTHPEPLRGGAGCWWGSCACARCAAQAAGETTLPSQRRSVGHSLHARMPRPGSR